MTPEQRKHFEYVRDVMHGEGHVPASDTSQERVDENEKQRHEQEPVAWMNDSTPQQLLARQ